MQKINYQTLTDEITKKINGANKPRLLLHACCAPCASYVIEYLTEYFDIEIYFYNPNILPEGEYKKRLEEMQRLCGLIPHKGKLSLTIEKYEPAEYLSAVRGLENEPEGGSRCPVCLGMRINETARIASLKGFDYFATTLTVSPHKNAELINNIGYGAAERYGCAWLPSDFKKRGGYLRSIEICREYSIYRQNYCGCGPDARPIQIP